MSRSNLKFAVICASNQNRSMEVHDLLLKKGVAISSYGTNSQIKIPGTHPSKPNVYSFGTSYSDIVHDLKSQDESYYRAQGLLQMVERNAQVKEAPERFQDSEIDADVIITCEDRCWEIVVDSKYRDIFHVVSKPCTIPAVFSKIKFCKVSSLFGTNGN